MKTHPDVPLADILPASKSESGNPLRIRTSQSRKTALGSFLSLMRAPGVYLRIVLTTIAFCLACYIHYRSLAVTIYYGAICATLMQIGYFGGVLYLVWKESSQNKAGSGGPDASISDQPDKTASRQD